MAVSFEHPLSERLGIERRALPWAYIGHWPTPITSLSMDGSTVWIKREDLSHPHYGGNKVRTLEVLLGAAASRGVTRIWSAGAYGSNHVVATLVHASVAGLAAGALLFPQPHSPAAEQNLRSSLSAGAPIVPVIRVAALPFAMLATWHRDRLAGHRPQMMPPGGASPLGALGALSAIFELAEQLHAMRIPPPGSIVVPVGSACTTAGILAGLALVCRLGRWPWPRPTVRSVRATPWPVTSHFRIVSLAKRTVELVENLRGTGSDITRRELAAHLVVDGEQLGPGYGHGTAAGREAAVAFEIGGGPALDSVYAAKAGAAVRCLLAGRSPSRAPVLLWSTKSAAPAPIGDHMAIAPQQLRRWLAEPPEP
jgi:D-cysteine desulfhydrase